MIVVDRSALVGRTAGEMYSLVADVGSYPLFLPWCDRAVVSVNEPGRTVAALHINFRAIRTSRQFRYRILFPKFVQRFRIKIRKFLKKLECAENLSILNILIVYVSESSPCGI